jgi:hypothetical protein
MGEEFTKFLSDHPFWAVFIAVFMILPMIGAVIHIILKALGRRGIDNSPPSTSVIPDTDSDGESSNRNNAK